MKIFEGLVQGSDQWLAVRAQHFCASDAPAVMGVSKYKTRGDFLREKATGHTPEVGPAKQALFNRGHAAEEAARPLVEEDLDEELYPCVGALDVDGMAMLASFDGQTMTGDIIWECKLWNESLAASVRAGELEPHYWAQLEHSLLVSGADRAYFTTTDGTREKFAGTWYEAVPERRAQLIAAWRQFAADLATYQHVEVLPAAVATEQASLPAVIVRMGGALTVDSNLPDFAIALREYIGTIPKNPSTDVEFADCEAACKSLKKAEDALQAAEDNALAGMTDVEQMRRVVAELRALARATRLSAEKTVEARKISIRAEILQEHSQLLSDHLMKLNQRLGKNYMPAVPADFPFVMKGKKTVQSLRDACSQELARAKIAANEVADRIQINLDYLRENAKDYAFLFADTASIVLKAGDDLAALVESRIMAHQKAEADRLERERAAIAEQERVKAEARVRVDQEGEDSMIAGIWQQARRIEGDRVGYIQKAIAYFEQGPAEFADDPRPRVAAAVAEARAEMAEKLKVAQAREEADRAARELIQQPAVAKPVFQPVDPVADQPMPEAVDQSAVVPIRPQGNPTMTSTKLCAILGFTVTADFLVSIGAPAPTKERAANYWHERQVLDICEALGQHLTKVWSEQKAKYQPARTRTAA